MAGFVFYAVFGAVLASRPAEAKPTRPQNPWPAATEPAPGSPESIGGHGAGCLRGGKRVPQDDPGYQVMRPSRRRYYAHPDMIAFLNDVARRAKAAGLEPFLVGDVGQARGGPTSSFHMSHQMGLDADLWYWHPAGGRRLTENERETLSAHNMVVPFFERPSKEWDPKLLDIVRLAAETPEVERLFVNPVIKAEACRRFSDHPAWLQKLRPWWGHDDHFHTRLRCPSTSPRCRSAAEPLPPGDGCGKELASWLTPERKAEARRKALLPSLPKMPVLPDACQDVLKSR